MSKRSSINKPLTTEGRPPKSHEESSIQKHVQFWDKSGKGYISPLDTISGFMTLGYSVLFSIALGAFVGVFLSLSTQTGWFPDPLCRSNVRNLIQSKKQTQGAFDEHGVFSAEKFEALFSKYAKSDPSGKTITMPELMRMTQEQERLGKNVKAWATSMVELCTAYFFIGHHGSIAKEDVRAAYDGSLFYRLKDNHKLMIQDKKQASSLKGSYLSKPASPLSVKALEHRMQVLFSALQSKSSIAAEYGVHDWVSYIQERTNSIRDHALPRALRRPTSIISGVTTPKSAGKAHAKEHDDPSKLFPDGLTGVAKATSEAALMGTEFLSSLLRHGADASDSSSSKTRGMHGIFGSDSGDVNMEHHQPILFGNVSAENPAITKENAADFPPLPKPSESTSTSNHDSLMNGFLKSDDAHAHEWLAAGLTGVQRQQEPESIKKTSNIPAKQTPLLPEQPKPVAQEPKQQQEHEQIPKASLTPPPEEKLDVTTATAPPPPSVTKKPVVSTAPINNKKLKK
ncbi:Caleosin related protein-domain-containing protein [Mucor lusitanicus]|uniref:Caleosin related protein-domain-containing protein n=1 Tax=Mucor circinelloides f. lusitanicus TaxID=29924 RepID=A0A8H4BLT3_MUCCL|nr:Caleosin related protein-domain-containing protein [Mucor lusitanicus]